MKKLPIVLLITGILISLLLLTAALFLTWLTVTEYRPEPVEQLKIENFGSGIPMTGTVLTFLTWNIGYASLDSSQDFFMDGGAHVRPATDANVKSNINGIKDFISYLNCNFVLIQEADRNSYRSYYLDETDALAESYGGSTAFAYNFMCKFVPIPVPRFIGRVESGVMTLSYFTPDQAERISLPTPFKWPVRIANLKRCLLVERFPLANSSKKLTLVNLHLEAYDDSGGREAQTEFLINFLKTEYAAGNYCIAGGDFNQNFPGVDENLIKAVNTDFFVPGVLREDILPAGWRFAVDTGAPTARLNNEPYHHTYNDTQLYVIDGFILSPNVELLSVETSEMDFLYSDHNPVKLTAVLR